MNNKIENNNNENKKTIKAIGKSSMNFLKKFYFNRLGRIESKDWTLVGPHFDTKNYKSESFIQIKEIKKNEKGNNYTLTLLIDGIQSIELPLEINMSEDYYNDLLSALDEKDDILDHTHWVSLKDNILKELSSYKSDFFVKFSNETTRSGPSLYIKDLLDKKLSTKKEEKERNKEEQEIKKKWKIEKESDNFSLTRNEKKINIELNESKKSTLKTLIESAKCASIDSKASFLNNQAFTYILEGIENSKDVIAPKSTLLTFYPNNKAGVVYFDGDNVTIVHGGMYVGEKGAETKENLTPSSLASKFSQYPTSHHEKNEGSEFVSGSALSTEITNFFNKNDGKLNFIPVDGQVIPGFVKRFEQSWSDIYEAITDYANSLNKNPADLHFKIVGHSMGGAVAHLTALRIFHNWFNKKNETPPIEVVTFGAPKILDENYANYYNYYLGENTYTFETEGDNKITNIYNVKILFQKKDLGRYCYLKKDLFKSQLREKLKKSKATIDPHRETSYETAINNADDNKYECETFKKLEEKPKTNNAPNSDKDLIENYENWSLIPVNMKDFETLKPESNKTIFIEYTIHDMLIGPGPRENNNLDYNIKIFEEKENPPIKLQVTLQDDLAYQKYTPYVKIRGFQKLNILKLLEEKKREKGMFCFFEKKEVKECKEKLQSIYFLKKEEKK